MVGMAAVAACILGHPGASWGQALDADRVVLGGGAGAEISGGSGSPEGAVIGSPGDVYVRTPPASASTGLYLKVTGTGTNTGWVEMQGRPIVKADLPASVAHEDDANTFTQSQVISVSGGAPQLTFQNTTGTGVVGLDTGGVLFSQNGSGGLAVRNNLATLDLMTVTNQGVVTVRDDLLPATAYAQSIGSPFLKWGALHVAELSVDQLVAREVAATTGGRVLVGPTTSTTADLAPTSTSLAVRHNILRNGSTVLMEKAGKFEILQVTSGPTETTDSTALSLDGTNDVATIPDAAALTLPDGDWTIAGWVKLTSNTGSAQNHLFGWGANSGSVPRAHLFVREATAAALPDDFCFNVVDDAGDGTGEVCSTTNPGQSTQWQHVTLTRSGTTYTLYVNGASVATTTAAAVDATNASTAWYFGGRTDATETLPGRLSSWAKWDRTLSGTEIGFLANGYATESVAGRVWAEDFVLTGAVLVEDVTGATVTLTNGAATTTDHPFIKAYTYTVTRDADGTGANYWAKGDAVFDTTAGWIDLQSAYGQKAPALDYIFAATSGGTVFSINLNDQLAWNFLGTTASDATYFGRVSGTWEDLFLQFTAGNAAPSSAQVEYWNGSSWASVVSVTVSTNFWTTAGLHSIQWAAGSQTGWAATTVNGVSAYWVRVRLATVGSYSTPPVQVERRAAYSAPDFGPVIQFNKRNSTAALDWSTRAAIGNLLGLYGYTAETYGAAFGSSAATAITIDDTNGIRVLNAGGVRGQWDASGVLTLGNTSTENIRVSSTDFEVRDGTTPLIRVNGTDGIRVPIQTGSFSGVNKYGFDTSGGTGVNAGLYATDPGGSSEKSVTLYAGIPGGNNAVKISATDVLLNVIGTGSVQAGEFDFNSVGTTVGATGRIATDGILVLGKVGTYGSLPAATNDALYMEGAISSTINGRIFIGDGGASDDLMFSKRTGSTTTDLFAFEETGELGIGTASPAYQIELTQDSAGKPTSSTWTIVSDARTKDQIRRVNPRSELRRVLGLELSRYRYTGAASTPTGAAGIGVTAQQARQWFPTSVRTIRRKLHETDEAESDILTFDWHEAFVAGLAAIQELSAELDDVRRELDRLRRQQRGQQ